MLVLVLAPWPSRRYEFFITELLVAKKLGPAAALPCPKPKVGFLIDPPYDLEDSPNPVRRKNCIVCIAIKSTRIAGQRMPKLCRAILAGGCAMRSYQSAKSFPPIHVA